MSRWDKERRGEEEEKYVLVDWLIFYFISPGLLVIKKISGDPAPPDIRSENRCPAQENSRISGQPDIRQNQYPVR